MSDTHMTHSESEKLLLDSWEKHRIFERSVEERPAEKRYTFYDGPPFATGLPHYGHLLASVIKDVVPRFWTMKGYRVERVWGWDCHGVPIENIIEKELNLKGGKKGIEQMGIGNFNAACRAAILRFDKEWEVVIRRIGRWVDFKHSYKTMDNSYMESVWWAFKTLHEKKLVYQGKRVILYCPRCATPLSNFEIAMDNSYKDVEDNSLYVKFKRKDSSNEYFLAWTTTPWTLPGNVGLAVDRDADYSKIQIGDEFLWVATRRIDETLKTPGTIVQTVKGTELLGLEYEPLYSFMPTEGKKAHYILPASFVSLDDGSGIVHTAAVFGEDDYKLAQEFDLPCVSTLDDEGKFLPIVTPLAGVFYKKSEAWIIEDLTSRGLVWRHEKFTHSYPMCYRCSTPLYYNAVPAWFIDVQSLKPKLIAQNENINWYPEHLKHGRFGKGLETAPDWNISRSRFWGTPMPVWVGDDGATRIIGSFADLKTWAVSPELVEELTDFHREFIDPIEVWIDDAKTIKGRRIPEVFDCWMESASMPFASIHAPFENEDKFRAAFPGGFVTEYIAQTRAWFYVMHVISVALFGSNAVQNILTTGTILAGDGQKMSKSKNNFPDPSIVLEKYGADAVRFYLMSNPIVNGENLSFNESGVDEVGKKFINILKNVVSFYQLYKEHDDQREPANSHVLDRWITARLSETLTAETEAIERYDLSDACRPLQSFVTDLSTWYLRRSRDRMKNSGDDRAEALATLRSTLITFSKMIAPFMPFLAEIVYRDVGNSDETDSVHLQMWPQIILSPSHGGVGGGIITQMGEARAIVSRIMEVRDKSGRAIKQALGSVTVTTPSGIIDERILSVILDEVNIKTATVIKGAELAVAVDINLTPALIREGIAREVTRRVNGLRKDSGMTIVDRISLFIHSPSAEVKLMFAEHSNSIKSDTLSSTIEFITPPINSTSISFRAAEQELTIGFVKV